MLLAIDIGRNMGWVLGAAVGPLRGGTIQLEDTTHLGRYLASMVDPLRPLIRECTAIAVEQPPTQGMSFTGIRKNMASLGMIHYLAQTYGGKPVEEISVTTGKLALAGHGRADKDQMVFAAIERGLTHPTEHEADAYGIWLVHQFGAPERNKKNPRRNGKGKSILKPEPEA